jgi:hypothetical protein
MNRFLLVAAFYVFCSIAQGQEIATTDKAAVCVSGGRPGSAYARAHRSYRPGRPGYEHDHIIPLCLGGADTEANLQWQPLDEAREKDKMESVACKAVCNGELSLDGAQKWFWVRYGKRPWQ